MDIRHVWHGHSLIVVVSGDLSGHGCGEEFMQNVLDAEAGRSEELVFDLAKSFIPGSRFIAKFVELSSLLRARRVRVHLRTSGNHSATEAFRLFSIDKIVDVFED